MIPIPAQQNCADEGAVTVQRRPLQRVLYAIALDGSQKLGSLEEQVYILAQAFRAERGLLLPIFQSLSDPARPAASVFHAAGLPIANLDLWGFRWKTFWQLCELIDRHEIEVMHWNFYPPINGYLLALSVLRPQLIHYFTDHNSREVPLSVGSAGVGRLIKRTLLSRYRKVLCVSRFVEECLAKQRSWQPAESCLHFINTDRFRPDWAVRQSVRQQFGCDDKFVVLAVAHLIPQKGTDVAIRAIGESGPNTVLWVVGGGSEAPHLQALAADLGLNDRVTFFGHQTEVQPFMQAADCLVCPSLWAEAAGLVNLEALSTGLPVLASRIGGIPEYVDDGKTGHLFTPGDFHELAMLLRRIQDGPEERRHLGEAARLTAIERFSVASRIDEYLSHYRS
jgi:glycosyltransferase involved in cell wall biosynthesis